MAQISSGRLQIVDAWRGLAILGMVIYHFFYAVDYFALIDSRLLENIYVEFIADLVRFSFLFLVGLSTYIIYSRSTNFSFFARKQFHRFFLVAFAAVLVSIATFFFEPSYFVFWGILHLIAFSVLIMTLTARNKWINLVLILILILMSFIDIDSKSLFTVILGTSALSRSTFDFFPIVPWLVVPLLGLQFGSFSLGILKKIEIRLGRRFGLLSLAGRHSLFIYLLHQPLIFGVIYIFIKL